MSHCHLSFTPFITANLADIFTSTTTDQVEANSGALKNTFDAEAVQNELDVQTRVTQTFDTNRQEVKAEINKKIDEAKTIADDKSGKYTQEQIAEANQKIEDMQHLGVLVDSISGALYSPSDNALGTVANTLSPAIVYEIGQYFKENEKLNKLDNGDRPEEGSAQHILAQTLVAAVTASLAGNDELTAGLSAGGAEIIAPKLAEWLYDKDPQDLTSEEKNTISAIISLGSAAVGATTGDTTDTISSSVAGTTAVEENRMLALEENALAYTKTALLVKQSLAKAKLKLTEDEINKIFDLTLASMVDGTTNEIMEQLYLRSANYANRADDVQTVINVATNYYKNASQGQVYLDKSTDNPTLKPMLVTSNSEYWNGTINPSSDSPHTIGTISDTSTSALLIVAGLYGGAEIATGAWAIDTYRNYNSYGLDMQNTVLPDTLGFPTMPKTIQYAGAGLSIYNTIQSLATDPYSTEVQNAQNVRDTINNKELQSIYNNTNTTSNQIQKTLDFNFINANNSPSENLKIIEKNNKQLGITK